MYTKGRDHVVRDYVFRPNGMQPMLEGWLISTCFVLFVITVQRSVAASFRFLLSVCWSEQLRRVTSSTLSRGASAS
jgi:hypothetical protein